MEVTSYTSTSVDATITASQSGRVVTTIPYDTGWTVTVDGSTVDMSAFKDTFVSFEVSEGTHTIHLSYTPDGFYLGLAVTLICIILLVMIAALIHLWKKNQAEEERLRLEEAAELSDTGFENEAPEENLPEDEGFDTEEFEGQEPEDEEFEGDKLYDDEFEEEAPEDMKFTNGEPEQKEPKADAKKTDRSVLGLEMIEQDLIQKRHNSLKEKTKAAKNQ